MRHLNIGRKFDRNASNRRAMFKNLVANLLSHRQIETTVAKAKEVRRITERVITKAKRLGATVDAKELDAASARRRLSGKRAPGKFPPEPGRRAGGPAGRERGQCRRPWPTPRQVSYTLLTPPTNMEGQVQVLAGVLNDKSCQVKLKRDHSAS